MSLLSTVESYSSEKAERAAFEAAMIERISSKEGYRMADLVFDLYKTQKILAALERKFEGLKQECDTALNRSTSSQSWISVVADTQDGHADKLMKIESRLHALERCSP